MTTTPALFKQELIERLAVTHYARQVALHGPKRGLAEELGVLPEVLEHAAVLARAGFGPPSSAIREALHVFTPKPITGPFLALARYEMRMGPGQLIRSLLHAVMQTTREPSPRSLRQWAPQPGCEAARARLVVLAQRLSKGQTLGSKRSGEKHLRIELSMGLHRALELRAMAFGTPRTRYCTLWIADLCDGLLADVPIPSIEIGQMYDAVEGYVVPILPAPTPPAG